MCCVETGGRRHVLCGDKGYVLSGNKNAFFWCLGPKSHFEALESQITGFRVEGMQNSHVQSFRPFQFCLLVGPTYHFDV